METVTGSFVDRRDAARAMEQVRAIGIPDDRLSLLTPDTTRPTLETVPTTETEQPGMGTALGSIVGGAAGLSTGTLGTAVASLFIPGVGPIIAIGFAATALAGIAGAAGGAALGRALESALASGLPRDELFVYEDALQQGRSLVIALAEDAAQAQTARDVFVQTGAESIDAAREQWWVGLRDAEAAAYAAPDDHLTRVERIYRSGFTAALDPHIRGQSYDEAIAYLRTHFPAWYGEEPFRRGYARGQAYQQARTAAQRREPSPGGT